jgi:hypothetical protein
VVERLAWLPAAAVGAAGAAAAELAVGLLLYDEGGFLGALTLVLSAEAAALACGFWAAPRDVAPPWSGIRRSWFVLLLALVLGASLAASWEALGGLAGSWLTRGLGLACLAALPLYATGAVLGARAMSEGEPGVPPGVPAAAGAAVGFAAVGVGPGVLEIAPLAYVVGVALVSLGALVQSRLLDERDRRWREWAAHGTARDGAEPGAPGALPPRPPSRPAAREYRGWPS